ncbi:MAG: helix-hairpin-helix domain-containing protein [Bacteroidota bacterium]|nr:helix-hairpin-helix domain-containing protein [Bacteroidota bacterium]
MKKRIEQFIKTYFYFNKNESKGIYLLLGLIVLTLGIKWSFSYLIPSEPIQLSLETLAAMDSLENEKDDTDPYSNYSTDSVQHNQKKFEYRTKPLFSKYKKDTIYPEYPKKKLEALELNGADSISLVKLYKIGPVLASKIVSYRNKLGGFISLNQLTEIWGFDTDLLYDLEGKIFVDPKKIKIFNLNTVSFEELKQHPYFKINLSQAIINYRKQHGNYHSMNELKKIKLVNDSIIIRISPYSMIE